MSENDIMPFGRFKGRTMREVPASHLLWFASNIVETDYNLPVHQYIRRNIENIVEQASNG